MRTSQRNKISFNHGKKVRKFFMKLMTPQLFINHELFSNSGHGNTKYIRLMSLTPIPTRYINKKIQPQPAPSAGHLGGSYSGQGRGRPEVKSCWHTWGQTISKRHYVWCKSPSHPLTPYPGHGLPSKAQGKKSLQIFPNMQYYLYKGKMLYGELENNIMHINSLLSYFND